MVISSPASAHPQRLMLVLRCKTIFEERMGGNLTFAYIAWVDSKPGTISKQQIRHFVLVMMIIFVLQSLE